MILGWVNDDWLKYSKIIDTNNSKIHWGKTSALTRQQFFSSLQYNSFIIASFIILKMSCKSLWKEGVCWEHKCKWEL